MASQKHQSDKTDIWQHDYEESSREQDRERMQNRHSFDSRADSDDYSTGRNESDYSEARNQSRFTDENDYPDGNTERYNEWTNEHEFGRNNIVNETHRAYDRSADYIRERDEDTPFINQNPDSFYGRHETVDGEGQASEQFTSDRGQRYFGGDMGYHTKHAQDDAINRAVTQKGLFKLKRK